MWVLGKKMSFFSAVVARAEWASWLLAGSPDLRHERCWRFPRFTDVPFSGLTGRAALFSPPQGAAPAWEQSTFYLFGSVAA